jgi:hypothetical protein
MKVKSDLDLESAVLILSRNHHFLLAVVRGVKIRIREGRARNRLEITISLIQGKSDQSIRRWWTRTAVSTVTSLPADETPGRIDKDGIWGDDSWEAIIRRVSNRGLKGRNPTRGVIAFGISNVNKLVTRIDTESPGRIVISLRVRRTRKRCQCAGRGINFEARNGLFIWWAI